MDIKLDEKLCANYPLIFRDRHAPMNETCMCWGFECDDGWYNIIDQLCNKIQSHINFCKIDQVVATQVKEKYGTLRFYYDCGDRYIDGLVAMAESMSAVTCEVCGNSGKTLGGGWIKTLCEIHASEGV